MTEQVNFVSHNTQTGYIQGHHINTQNKTINYDKTPLGDTHIGR